MIDDDSFKSIGITVVSGPLKFLVLLQTFKGSGSSLVNEMGFSLYRGFKRFDFLETGSFGNHSNGWGTWIGFRAFL